MRPERGEIFRVANPATMTLDDLVDCEQKMGLLPAPRSAELVWCACVSFRDGEISGSAGDPGKGKGKSREKGAEALSSDDEDENEEAAEAKQTKDRKWDDWKDDHEKGAGKLKTRY